MNTTFYIVHMYVTRILLVTGLAYAFLTHGCPTCQGRLESTSPAFFSDEGSATHIQGLKRISRVKELAGQSEVKIDKNISIELETRSEKENHA